MFMEKVISQMENIIYGQSENIKLLIASLLAGGHVLLEGVPGLGKTKMVRTLASLMDGSFRRIQFTPDMMPSDMLGNVIYNMQTQQFETIKGPIFTQWLLADEINRTPPKTQAALLEAMEERQVTLQGTTYPLPDPFFVIATQNPVEYEGTYILPEAQLDRFICKLVLGYPSLEEEKRIYEKHHYHKQVTREAHELEHNSPEVLPLQQFFAKQGTVDNIVLESSITDYIARLIQHTRQSGRIQLGASPRAGLALIRMSKAWATLDSREYVTPDDVKNVAIPVLRHRLIPTPQAELEGITSDQLIQETLASVEVPR
jgi:MoxR-like ATPase